MLAAGSDVAGIRTTAVLSPGNSHYVVNGAKKWITNGLWADYVTAAVRTGGPGPSGISMLIIPLKDTPGITRRRIRNSGLNASGSTYIGFNNVRVPVGNLIGKENEGFKIIMANFNPERLSLAVGSLRLARTCFEEAWGHALRRKTFGKPLMDNQVMRAKFAAMARAIESCHAWIEQIVYQIQNQEHPAQDLRIGARIALVKVHAGKVFFSILIDESCKDTYRKFYHRLSRCVVEKPNKSLGGEFLTVLLESKALRTFSLGVSKEGKGHIVEQISRDLRVFVVGGGSEEIMDDLAIRLVTGSKL